MTIDQHHSELAAVVAALEPKGGQPVDLATPWRRRAVEVLGSDAVAWAVELAAEVAAGMQVRHPDDAAPVHDITDQSEILVLQMLMTLVGADHSADRGELTTRSEASVRELLAVGAPFERIGETLQLATELVIRTLLRIASTQQVSADALTSITLVVTQSANVLIAGMADQYMLETQRFADSGERARQQMIDALIAGHPMSSNVVRRVVKVSLNHHHMGVVVSGTAQSPLDAATLRRSVEVVTSHLGAPEITLRHKVDSAWLWATAPRPISLDTEVLASSLGDAVRVGVGTCQPHAAGFRRTHLEALSANRFGRQRSSIVCNYRKHALAILLSADEERARWFVESELGELALPTHRNLDLLNTLRCYYDSRLRIASAAEQMHVHRNTAISRLATLEAMLGHPVTERMAELQAALAIFDLGGHELL